MNARLLLSACFQLHAHAEMSRGIKSMSLRVFILCVGYSALMQYDPLVAGTF